VTLHGADDTPDRYGRQTAFVFVAGSEAPVQNELRRQGAVLFSANVADGACAGTSPRPRPRHISQNRNLVSPHGHKKRGKSGRYFGRDWTIYGG
jgi:hypothetical protein